MNLHSNLYYIHRASFSHKKLIIHIYTCIIVTFNTIEFIVHHLNLFDLLEKFFSFLLANLSTRERSKFIIKECTYCKGNGAFIICESYNCPARHNYFEEHTENVHRGIDYRTHHGCEGALRGHRLSDFHRSSIDDDACR